MTGPGLRAGVVLVCVFLFGAVTGVFIERHHSISTHAPDELSPQEVHEAAMTEMEEVLQLDEEQIEKIHAILADNQAAVQRAWEQLRPHVHEAMNEVHVEIAAVLTPDQRERYHRWLSHRAGDGGGEAVIRLPH